jgi:hypothetical protein
MATVWKFSFRCQFDSTEKWTIGARNLKFYMKINYKHTYKLCVNIVYKSTIMKMLMVQKYEATCAKFNVD